MISDEQLERLRALAQLFAQQLPDDDAQNAVVLLFDVCEILALAPERLAGLWAGRADVGDGGGVWGGGLDRDRHILFARMRLPD